MSCVHHVSYFAQHNNTSEPKALGFYDARGQEASQFSVSGGSVAQNKDRHCPTAHGWNAVTLCGMLKNSNGRAGTWELGWTSQVTLEFPSAGGFHGAATSVSDSTSAGKVAETGWQP